MTVPELTGCDVCGEDRPFQVAALPGIPMSVAMCDQCRRAGAIPLAVLIANTAAVDGLAHAAPWWLEVVDDTLRHLDVSGEQFEQLVAQAQQEMAAMMPTHQREDDSP